MLFKILGGILVLWGIADLVMGMQGMDLWARVGITLPAIVWSFSHWIAIIAGGIVFSMGSADEEQEAPHE
ncbi:MULTISPECIES: hypothetical protein [unclassified Yoonia]|uniref:hypothetical protein n=1 Tax=unclassified Yoonia TaxID=2629118 RepID=UPI00372B39A4